MERDAVFDRVVLSKEGKRSSLTAEEFGALPLDQRVRCLLERAVEFYLGATPVDRRLALASLRRTA